MKNKGGCEGATAFFFFVFLDKKPFHAVNIFKVHSILI